MPYQLYYWSHVQGRGEVIRLALEEAGVDYTDVAREQNSEEESRNVILNVLQDKTLSRVPFAPPFLVDGGIMIAQAANILLYLSDKIGLAPPDEPGRIFAHQIQLTVTDFLMEVHDTHHPISNAMYYEDQVEEAKMRSANFIENRIPKHMAYYQNILNNNPTKSKWLIGETLTYPDLSIFQIVEGLRYAFPNAFSEVEKHYPKIIALRDAISIQPNTAKYLTSKRRIPFNNMGVFRHYPELDK